MVELQRARLGLPPPTPAITAPGALSIAERQPLSSSSVARAPAVQHQMSQQHLAATTLYSEEEMLQKFLKRLQQQRDGGSTVPTSLARRMLHRQGVGYLDETVAMLTAAAADRFLATVLQQGVACRDRRVAGRELSNEQSARRRKHVSLYQQDSDYRKRRKLERTSQKLQANVAAVAAARDLSHKASTAENKANASKKKNTKKNEPVEEETNGMKVNDETIGDEEVLDEDSLDDEERYYEDYYGEFPEVDDDDEAEEDCMLLLRDLQRPLEAWHFKLTGKVGLGAIPMEAVEPSSMTIIGETADDVDNDEDAEDTDELENGDNGDSRARTPKPSPSKENKSVENAPDLPANSTSRATTPMTAVSPAPK